MKKTAALVVILMMGLPVLSRSQEKQVSTPSTASQNRLLNLELRPKNNFLSDNHNDCDALLKDGVFDEHDIYGSSFQTAVFLNRFCSANYISYQ